VISRPLFKAHTLGALLALGGACWLGACAGSRTPPQIAETPSQISAQIDRAKQLAREAQRYADAGKDEQAIEKYRQAIDAYRELPAAWNNLGELMMKRGDNLAAAEAFKTASELSPTDPVSLHNLGALWESLGYLDDACRWYGEALKRNENYLPSLRRIVVVEEIRNKPTSTTLDYIRHALLVERDPWWQDKFRRDRLRFEDLIASAKADAMNPARAQQAAPPPAATLAPSPPGPQPTIAPPSPESPEPHDSLPRP